MIELRSVRSGRVARWGFEADRGAGDGSGMLVLEFRDGSTWVWRSISERDLANFLMAESKGRFVEQLRGRYGDGEKIEEGLDWMFRRA